MTTMAHNSHNGGLETGICLAQVCTSFSFSFSSLLMIFFYKLTTLTTTTILDGHKRQRGSRHRFRWAPGTLFVIVLFYFIYTNDILLVEYYGYHNGRRMVITATTTIAPKRHRCHVRWFTPWLIMMGSLLYLVAFMVEFDVVDMPIMLLVQVTVNIYYLE